MESLQKHGYEVDMVAGVTPATLDFGEFPFPLLPKGRLADFHAKDRQRYLTKLSCLYNHIRFARRVIDEGQPVLFLEHDVLAVAPLPHMDFESYCFLGYETALRRPGPLPRYRGFVATGNSGINDFPADYPMKYHKRSIYHGAVQTPGTGAYALMPAGAELILAAAERGLDQSDFLINAKVLRLQYVFPSPFRYQSKNLGLSHGLDKQAGDTI